ncbi:HNH endonuclease signature motif containing protein [Arthrobacter sp. H20]|uniref:HNH endonuclease signature motif containing protein n=1 Tax=Arthrobacter sp. H20 TaxID=1267981 RepID=UPI0004BCD64E|nr:HNH endonuclease signature motif containing protein [Arthrobacter sp. H20]
MKSSKAYAPGAGIPPESGADSASDHGSTGTSAGYGVGGPLSVDAEWIAPVADGCGMTANPGQSGPDARVRSSDESSALTGQLGLAAPAGLGSSQALDALRDVAEARSWLDAQEAKLVTRILDLQAERIHGGRGTLDFDKALAASEVGAALRLPERTAGSLIEHSTLLTRHYPATLHALEGGRFSRRHAWAVVEEASNLPDVVPAVTVAYESKLIAMAGKTTVAKFSQQAHRLLERLHPESITTRHKKAVQGRLLQLSPAYDGMAWLEAYLPVVQAAGIFHRVDTAARALQGPDEPRTLTQLRADVFTDVLTSAGPNDGDGVQAKVFVTVPVMTLLGGDTPGELEGYGPIDPDAARRLAGHAPSFTRILTHPSTGARLGADATTYRVPKDLQDSVRVRDRTCRHPGCNRLAVFCELDHTIPWASGGKTSYSNLACLCKRHHMFKTEGYWHYQQPEAGTIIAISPAGETYTTRPDPPPEPRAPDPPPF